MRKWKIKRIGKSRVRNFPTRKSDVDYEKPLPTKTKYITNNSKS